MTDLSALSDGQLQALYGHSSSTPDLASMSDADLMKAYGAAPEKVGRGEDAAKGAASGLANATIGTLGTLGDVTNFGAKGIEAASNYVSDKLGIERYQPSGKSILNKIPTSESVRASVTDPMVPLDYKPQYVTGELAQKGGEFLPNALLGGGWRGLAQNVVAPAVGSWIGEKVAGPVGGIAGAVLSGAGATKLANAMAEAKAIKAATPTLADTKSAATNVYDNLTAGNAASPIAQSTLDNLAGDIRTRLNNSGVRPSNAKGIHDALDELQNPATRGAADVQDLVAARESIKNQLSAPDASKKGAFIALPKIEAEIERLSPGTMKDIREADKNYGAFKASEALDKRMASADLRASAVDSGMNVGNKIRQKVASLLESGEARYLSAETKADLEKIVRGTWTQNGMRHVANLLGGGGGLGMLAGGTAGYEAGGWGGALAGAATGRAFKIGNNRSVVKQAEEISRNIRMRSPLGQQNPLTLPAPTSTSLAALRLALLARPNQ